MILIGLFISSICTSLGALPVLLIRNVSHKWKDIMLAYTAGIMVAASAYGLIPPVMKLSNIGVLALGIILGTAVLTLLESFIPHTDMTHSTTTTNNASVLLFLIAMSMHNLPEGLSVGISLTSSEHDIGRVVSFAIGLQNIPEGFLVALFMVTQGVSRLKAIFFSTVTAFIELFAGVIGVLFGSIFESVLPYGLAFAAGSMLFVVYKELIPESHGDGNERASTIAFILGFISMIFLTDFYR
jgi:zinc transporter, ZIP family